MPSYVVSVNIAISHDISIEASWILFHGNVFLDLVQFDCHELSNSPWDIRLLTETGTLYYAIRLSCDSR